MSTSKYTGWRMPYGYTPKNKTAAIQTKEAKVVKHIYSMFLDGKLKREILYYLNANNIKSQTGKEWSSGTLSYLFKKEKIMYYAGYINKKRDVHEPIIDLATAKKLIALLPEASTRPRTREYLLSNIDVLHCGYCGGRAKTQNLPIGKDRAMRDYYYCTTKQMFGARSGKCSESRTVLQKDVDNLVLTDLTVHAGNINIEKYLVAYTKQLKLDVEVKAKAINQEINSLMENQYKVTSAQDQAEIAEKLNSLMKQRQQMLSPFTKIVTAEEVKTAKRIKYLSMPEQKELIKKLVFRIDLFNDKVVIHYNFGIKNNGSNIVELRFDNGKLVSKKK
jgi:hypothetical protein